MGGVAGVSTTTDLGRSGDATISSHGLLMPTPVVGLDILYLMVFVITVSRHDLEDYQN